jgi:hypothetical protein
MQIGQDVNVVSGPHAGVSGRVVYIRDYSQAGSEPEPYAIVEYHSKNCFDETYIDQVSVPVRRLSRTR